MDFLSLVRTGKRALGKATVGTILSWAGSVFLFECQSKTRGEVGDFFSSGGRRFIASSRDGDRTENTTLRRDLFPHFYQSSEGELCLHIGSEHK